MKCRWGAGRQEATNAGLRPHPNFVVSFVLSFVQMIPDKAQHEAQDKGFGNILLFIDVTQDQGAKVLDFRFLTRDLGLSTFDLRHPTVIDSVSRRWHPVVHGWSDFRG